MEYCFDYKRRQEFIKFLDEARRACYLDDGSDQFKVKAPRKKGHTEYRYTDGDWTYMDSYSGSIQSWGQELVWYEGNLYWSMSYGGSVNIDIFPQNASVKKIKELIISCLKLALSEKKDESEFQPRGKRICKVDNLIYECLWKGDEGNFVGHETITLQNAVLFHHDFFGGFFK